jgi:CxxC-x17-CxxC domain-containing protein
MSYGPREMHDAVFAECGQECQVQFKLDQSRPVSCRGCYAKKRPPEEIDIKLTKQHLFMDIFLYPFFSFHTFSHMYAEHEECIT